MKRLLLLWLPLAFLACSGEPSDQDDSELPDWWGDTSTDTRRDPGVDVAVDVAPDVAPDVEEDIEEDVPDVPVEQRVDGEPCVAHDQCDGRRCLADPEWPDGYCTQRLCRNDDGCAGEAICTSFDDASLCMATCTGNDECREGYWCGPARGRQERVCTPGEDPNPPLPDGEKDGEPCEEDTDCAGGTCFQDPEWPGGYCSTTECTSFADCARGADNDDDIRCLLQEPTSYCVRTCSVDEQCRSDEGYICQAAGGGVGVCVPGFSEPPARDLGLDDYPFEIVCGLESSGGSITIDYTIAEGTTAYLINPMAIDGSLVQPVSIQLPDGGSIDLRGTNAYQLTPSLLFGFLNPIVVPAIPNDHVLLQAGAHSLTVQTRSTDLCWYLLEEDASAGGDQTIDLNIYLVGLETTPETAEEDADLAAVIETAESIFEGGGITFGTIRYLALPDEIAVGYEILSSDRQVQELVEWSDRPGETTDDALSVNVFFVRGFAFSGGSVLGISMGLPGAAGIHGTRSSGVSFTTEYMTSDDLPGIGNGNVYTGVVLAHEIGHYLGLFHTTEQGGAGFDPLSDTPECRSGFPSACPDLNNLMFPYAGSDHTTLRAGQYWMLNANPLTKP